MPRLTSVRSRCASAGTSHSTRPRSRPSPGRSPGSSARTAPARRRMFNVITGPAPPTSGRIVIDDEDVTGVRLHKRARKGLARTFQRLELFSMLTVGRTSGWRPTSGAGGPRTSTTPPRSPSRSSSGSGSPRSPTPGSPPCRPARGDWSSWPGARLQAQGCCCSTSRRRARTTRRPSASRSCLVELAEQGTAVVLVEHDMSLVMEVCHLVHVLNLGAVIATGEPPPCSTTRRCSTPTWAPARRRPRERGNPAPVEPRRWPSPARAARPGPATTASGAARRRPGRAARWRASPARTERGRQVDHPAGGRRLLPATSGDVMMAGRRVNGARPEDLARFGLCLIPEGRGIFPNLTVRENLWMMTPPRRVHEAGRGDDGPPASRSSARFMQRTAGTLSGGEQQMLAMARGLATDPPSSSSTSSRWGSPRSSWTSSTRPVNVVASEGTSILLVEQFARIVMDVADEAAVMVQGGSWSTVGPETSKRPCPRRTWADKETTMWSTRSGSSSSRPRSPRCASRSRQRTRPAAPARRRRADDRRGDRAIVGYSMSHGTENPCSRTTPRCWRSSA